MLYLQVLIVFTTKKKLYSIQSIFTVGLYYYWAIITYLIISYVYMFCSGEANIDDTSHTALSVHQRHQLANSLPSSIVANKNKGKRKSGSTGNVFNNHLDKMLTDRMMNIADNKKFCDSPSTDNIFYEKNKCATDIGMDYVKSNGDLTIVNNNNTIKSERLSPTSHQNGSNGAAGDPVPPINSSRYSIQDIYM